MLASVAISEVDDGGYFADALFRRKFDAEVPRAGRHVVAFHRCDTGTLRVLAYAHFFPFGDLYLVGGVCTDGDVIRAMNDDERARISAAGGVYYQVLKYGFARFANDCEAYFGYCGNARAEQVNLAAGFVKTTHPYLLVHWHKPLHEVLQRALIAKAAAIGPF